MHLVRVLVAACAVISTVTATEYNITVGKLEKGLTVFERPFLSGLKAGDRFTFDFSFINRTHEIYQSTFEDPGPCKRNMINGSSKGIVNTTTFRVTETIQDGPLWYFCSVQPHCQNGMVFALNPPGPDPSATFEAFKAKAASLKPSPTPVSGAKKISTQKMNGLAGVALVGLLVQ